MNKKEHLAQDVERALAEYLGVPAFDAEEWPMLARAFADVVAASQVHRGLVSPSEVAYNARELTHHISGLVASVAALVE